jgi:hypothetical protein
MLVRKYCEILARAGVGGGEQPQHMNSAIIAVTKSA